MLAFSKVITPITRLLKKEIPFRWSKEENRTFQTLPKHFTTAPILHHPDPQQSYFVGANALDTAFGVILSQQHPETDQLDLFSYYSIKLSTAEINYTVSDTELLAIKSPFEEWMHYLLGDTSPVMEYTDH